MDELADYDYQLPPERIAREPLEARDASRLLVVDRRSGRLHHRSIRDLAELLRPGDCLVLNDTQVLPARLFGVRRATGGKWEGLFLNELPGGRWQLIGHSGGKLQSGETIDVVPAHDGDAPDRMALMLLERDAEGIWTVQPSTGEPTADALRRFGTVPLPPYIRRKLGTASDWERYQTAYARRPGSVAAPTAGLHFTPELLAACAARGVERAFVTLHVGIGTFRPIAVDRLAAHAMHAEWCEIGEDACRQLARVRGAGGRIVAVGTTSVRTLETAARGETIDVFRGPTDLFIRPPHEFRAVDCLLTNFHLPRSTLFVLVGTFGGIELMRRAYAEALREGYRFYSYGDAMLIL